MKTTIQIKLYLINEQKKLIKNTMQEYVVTVNRTMADFVKLSGIDKRTTKDVKANIPSALINQTISDAKSIFKKYKKDCSSADNWNKKHISKKQKTATVPILRKPIAIWNNQNWKINGNYISFPVWNNGKCQRILVKTIIPTEILERLTNSKLGTLRITMKNNKIIAQIAVDTNISKNNNKGILGVDLGLKIPAVCVTDNGKVCFIGNGRKNKYIKRKFRSRRKKLGKAKKLNAIRKSQNKEQRIMKDIDHKLSRKIINFAKSNNIGTIRLEKLANIRKTARTSRKNEKNLHTWSFYRLAQNIEYKANLIGIGVQYVNPAYTSQICPSCGKRNHANDRKYICACGFHGHRDIVGARNIINAPVISGNSLSA